MGCEKDGDADSVAEAGCEEEGEGEEDADDNEDDEEDDDGRTEGAPGVRRRCCLSVFGVVFGTSKDTLRFVPLAFAAVLLSEVLFPD